MRYVQALVKYAASVNAVDEVLVIGNMNACMRDGAEVPNLPRLYRDKQCRLDFGGVCRARLDTGPRPLYGPAPIYLA